MQRHICHTWSVWGLQQKSMIELDEAEADEHILEDLARYP